MQIVYIYTHRMCAVCDTYTHTRNIYMQTQRHNIITEKFWFLSIFVKRRKPVQHLFVFFFFF